MNDRFVGYEATIDRDGKSITLIKSDAMNPKAVLSFQRPAADRLVLEGEMDGHRVRMKLELLERQSVLLVNRGFHWVQEYPFNR